MKKSTVKGILIAAAVLSFVATGCTKNSGSASSGKAKAEEITWMFWDDLEATTDLTSQGYAKVVEKFNKTYEGKYHVTPITTNLEEYDQKIAALIAAGNCPDAYICNPGPNLTVYVDNGSAKSLNDIMDKNKDWYNSFTKGIFERITYDGKIMAIPTCFQAALVFYNTEIFEQAGAKVPTTFDELIEACKKIQAIGKTPITCSAGTPWCLSMVAGYLCDRAGGPDNLKKVNAGETDWNDPTFKNGISKLVELSKYFQPTAAGDSNDQATAAFYNEEAAMLIQGSWVIGQMNGANPAIEAKCGVFSFPAIPGAADPNRMIVKTDNIVMSATTKHEDAVVALMKMFTDEEAQKYMGEVAGKIPVTGVNIDLNKAPKQLGYVMDMLSRSTGTLGFYNESFESVEAGDAFDAAVVDAFLGAKTVDEALAQINDFFSKKVWKK